jgi:hypothetical protein
MKNIMFDLAASIITDKDFYDLSVSELIEAARNRLDIIEEENNTEAFGFCDEYDQDEE